MKRGGPLKRTSQLKRSPFPSLRPGEPPRLRAKALTTKRTPDPITPQVRAVIKERSGDVCESCRAQRGQHAHHRQLRRFGDHKPANLVWICHRCHALIHHKGVKDSSGWLLSSTDNARFCPLLTLAGWVFLADDGSTTPAHSTEVSA